MPKKLSTHGSLRYTVCPRVPDHTVEELGDIVKCSICGSFQKEDIDLIHKGLLQRDEILTTEEMESIFDTLEVNPEKSHDLFF